MASSFHRAHNKRTGSKAPPTGVRMKGEPSIKEGAPNWPGLPGKSGPDRSGGTKKIKTHAVSKGI